MSFRGFAAREAVRLELFGWVRNDDDGSVVGHFEGPEADVEEMVQWCHRGSPSAHVRDELGFTSRHVQTLVDFDDRVLLHSDGELEDVEDLVRARFHGWSWGRIVGPLRPVGETEAGADYKWASLERAQEHPEMLKGAAGLRLALESEGLGVVHAVDGVSFRLDHGEALGIAGESGCGKTTTALSLVRILPANATIVSGRISLMGIDLVPKTENALRRYRWREISIVFQGAMNALNPVRRIRDQIAEPIEERLGESPTSSRIP